MAADDHRAELVYAAVKDALDTPCDSETARFAQYRIAVKLRDMTQDSATTSPSVVQPSACRHGVPYASMCGDCDL